MYTVFQHFKFLHKLVKCALKCPNSIMQFTVPVYEFMNDRFRIPEYLYSSRPVLYNRCKLPYYSLLNENMLRLCICPSYVSNAVTSWCILQSALME